jgi:hypothetical protein
MVDAGVEGEFVGIHAALQSIVTKCNLVRVDIPEFDNGGGRVS